MYLKWHDRDPVLATIFPACSWVANARAVVKPRWVQETAHSSSRFFQLLLLDKAATAVTLRSHRVGRRSALPFRGLGCQLENLSWKIAHILT